MKMLAGLIVTAGLSLVCCAASIAQETSKPAGQTLFGAWRGESKCLVRPSACNDEDSLYRFSAGGSPARVRLSANKIVGGKEINMGNSECRYEAASHGIDCPLPNGNSIHFDVGGTVILGKMTMRDGTLWRRINLHKIEEK